MFAQPDVRTPVSLLMLYGVEFVMGLPLSMVITLLEPSEIAAETPSIVGAPESLNVPLL